MKKLYSLSSVFSLLFISQTSWAGPYDDMYMSALLTSPVVARVHADAMKWRDVEQKEMASLFEYVRDHEGKDESLKGKVKAALEEDQKYFSALSASMKGIGVGKQGMTYQISSNKMGLGAGLALELLCKGDSFEDITGGKLPKGYSIERPPIITVGDEDHIYASGRGIALKQLLLRTAMQLSGCSISGLTKVLGFDVKESPFVQYTPLPTGLKFDDIGKSPYFVDGDSGNFMAVVHNGYTFGGHRNETPKQFGPHDCSSFIAKYAGCKPVSTFHQATYYQLREGFQFTGEKFTAQQVAWEKEKGKHESDTHIASLFDTLTPVKIFDAKGVKPGMIHAERTYRGISTKPEVALWGNGGHTSITIGTVGQGEDAKAITIGTNRDIEGTNRDGMFFLEPRPLIANPVEDERMVMYFDIKG